MSNFLIPLTNVPQNFQIELGGKNYLMTCRWNDAPEGGWCVDFADGVTNEPIIANVPLVAGVDLLDGLAYLGFNGSLFVYTDGAELQPPTLENLGVESNLYFQTEAS